MEGPDSAMLVVQWTQRQWKEWLVGWLVKGCMVGWGGLVGFVNFGGLGPKVSKKTLPKTKMEPALIEQNSLGNHHFQVPC